MASRTNNVLSDIYNEIRTKSGHCTINWLQYAAINLPMGRCMRSSPLLDAPFNGSTEEFPPIKAVLFGELSPSFLDGEKGLFLSFILTDRRTSASATCLESCCWEPMFFRLLASSNEEILYLLTLVAIRVWQLLQSATKNSIVCLEIAQSGRSWLISAPQQLTKRSSDLVDYCTGKSSIT